MKKIISSVLAASLALTCMIQSVSASGRVAGISEALSNKEEIHILYNDKIVQYEDVKPINTNDRVMIPFRVALESMGAKVDYDDAQRLVTAQKGDITITFTLQNDTIYINNNGEQSTITMDVPMVIISDRTFVPIRFMSNALGMQVGWDGDSQTVVIMDYNDYFDELKSAAPNLTELFEAEKSNLNKSTSAFDVSFATEGAAEDVSLAVSGSADTVVSGSSAGIDAHISVKSKQMSIDKANVAAAVDGTKLYIKTDVLSKLGDTTGNESIKAAAAIVNGSTWYAIDLVKLFESFGADEVAASLLVSALTEKHSQNIEEALKSAVTTSGDAVFDEVIGLASVFDAYEAIDKYVKLTKDGSGYSVSLKLSPEDFADVISNYLGISMSANEKAEFVKAFNCTVDASARNSGNKQNGEFSVSLKASVESEVYTLNIKVSNDSEEDSSAAVEIPQSSVDITDMVISLLK